MLLIHGTGTDSRVFAAAADQLAAASTVFRVDRRGWGGSPPPPDYRRTSIAEQAIEVAGTLRRTAEARDSDPVGVTVAGLGFGAVVALEMALAEPDLVASVLMIEPPMFGGLPAATEPMSADVVALRDASDHGGEIAAYELFAGGGLPTLGAGAERFNRYADHSAEAARSFLVETPAVPAWPLDPVRLTRLEAEVTVATAESSPPILREAATWLATQIPAAARLSCDGDPEMAPTELLSPGPGL